MNPNKDLPILHLSGKECYDKNLGFSIVEKEKPSRQNLNRDLTSKRQKAFLITAAFIFCAGFLFFGLAGQASAATYYVSPSGLNTSPYDTWAKAANLPSTIISLNPVGGPHTVYIAPGTYTDNMSIINANWAGSSFIGTTASGSTADATKGQVLITKAASATFRTNQNAVTAKNLSFTGTDSTHDTIYIDGTNFTGVNLYAYDSGQHLFYASNATGLSIKESKFSGAGYNRSISFIGTTAGTIEHNIFSHSPNKYLDTYNSYGEGIQAAGSGIINFYNNIVVGADGGPYFQEGTGTSNVSNNIILAGQIENQYVVARTAGTLNLTNNLIVSTWWNNHKLLSGTINTDSGNIKTSQPFFVRRARSGIIVPAVDDENAITSNYIQDLETELSIRGMRGTYFLYVAQIASNLSAIQSLLSGSVTLGIHSYSHSDLNTADNTAIWTLTGCTVTVDRTSSGTITIVGTPGGTINNTLAASLATIRAGLVTSGCTVTDGYYGTGKITSLALGEAIKTAPAGSTALRVLIDNTNATGLFKTEMVYAKSLAESELTGYTAKIFGTPGGAYNSDVGKSIKAAGYLGNRNIVTSSGLGWRLGSIDLFTGGGVNVGTTLIGATDADTIANTRALCEAVANYGFLFYLYTHTTADATVAQWRLILDTIKEYNEITVTDADTAVSMIRSAPWSLAADCTDGGTTATCTASRTWTDQSDYHLQSTSPAIDVGTNVSLTSDYAGNNIYGTPDIGGYEYQPPYTFAANNIPTTGSARLYSDGKYRMLTATSSSATGTFSVMPASGSYLSTTSQYMDITINTWTTSNKEWVATSTDGAFQTHATSTVYTIGDLLPSTSYQFKVDGTASSTGITGDTCTNGLCLSDSSGNLTFTYSGGYSTHTFDLEENPVPQAPTIGTPSALSSSSIRWNFTDNASDETGFRVYDNLGAIATSSATANLSYLDEIGLSANTQYTGRYVTAYNNSGNSASSSVASSIYTLANQVSSLSAANATDKSNYKINLTWTNQGQTGMKIEKDSGCDGYDTTLYDNAAANATSPYTVTVSGNTCYKFRIFSYNHDGAINSSSIPETSQITTPPAQPTGLNNTAASESSITWDWADVTGATGYKVYRASDDTLLTTISSATSNWTQSPLSSNTQYSVYVRATNANGEGIASSNASAYTSANAPTNASHSIVTTSSINWTWVSGTSQKEYYAWTTTPVDNSGWIIDTFWNQTNLSSNTSYTVSIKARNQNNDETGSISVSAYTLAPTPTNLAATAGLITMDLSVDAFNNPTAGSSGYYFSNSTNGTNSGWIQTSSWSNSGLSCGTSYTYTVKYRNGDGTETDPISLTQSTNSCPGNGPLPPSNAYTNWLAQSAQGGQASSEGKLIQYPNDPKVYLIKDGQKQWIKDEQTFNSLNLKWSDIVQVPITQTYPDGEVIQAPTIAEGGLIRAIGDVDVYIVKYVGDKQFKRLILNPSVFKSYGHLKWSDVQEVDQSVVDSFTTSDLVRAVNDPKVYKLYPSGDTGEKRWIETADVFLRMGFDWDSIYQINQIDRDSYIEGPVIE